MAAGFEIDGMICSARDDAVNDYKEELVEQLKNMKQKPVRKPMPLDVWDNAYNTAIQDVINLLESNSD